MPIVQPPQARHSIEEIGYSLKITIPSRKNLLILLFLGFWLIGWAFGEIIVAGMLLAGAVGYLTNSPEISKAGAAALSGGGLFMLVWLGMWTVGGGFALYTFFWQLVGKEQIEVGSDSIKIQRAIFGLGRTQEYLSAHIRDLRVTPFAQDSNPFGFSRGLSLWGLAGGHLAFDYGSQTRRFGSGVEEAEASQILAKILARFPQYQTRNTEIG